MMAILGGLSGVAMAARAAATPGGYPQDPLTALSTVVAILSYGSVGLILRIRRPDHTIGWLFLGIALTAAGSNLAWGIMALQSEQPSVDPSWLYALTLASSGLVIAWILLINGLLLCFPAGRPAGRHEHLLLRAAIIGAPVLGVALLVRPGPLVGLPAFDNPLAPSDGPTGLLFPLAFLWEIVIAALAIVAMAHRYREGDRELRHQIRWFALGAIVVVAASVLFIGAGLVVPTSEIAIWNIVYVIWALSLVALPVAVLFAITRHRLYDIDRILGRAFVIAAMAAILAGLFAASMRLLEALVIALTGERSDIVVVVTTLILTTTFTPLKGWLERFPRRWFKDDAVAESVPGPGAARSAIAPAEPIVTTEDLDARIERIARRVSEAVLSERESR
jgi:hypothetical protein